MVEAGSEGKHTHKLSIGHFCLKFESNKVEMVLGAFFGKALTASNMGILSFCFSVSEMCQLIIKVSVSAETAHPLASVEATNGSRPYAFCRRLGKR